ncbi:MAG: hypothetical protein B6242_02200 [Anaerolineaceae bacterium 4572_78]|nr:MAG: hypothetical protein B6242_02200 [Anaerolineaceae bacterium 4572_78]
MKKIKEKLPFIPYLLILLATILRFYHLGMQSLWSDEGNSLALAQVSFAEIASRTAYDIHPPFYYWLLKIWLMLFGYSEFATRSLSAMLGVILVVMIYRLAWQLFDRKVGLIAMWVAMLSPFQIYYAQETRMYMLLAVLGTGCVVMFVGWIEKQNLTYLMGYVIFATMGLYTQYTFPVILIIINVISIAFLWQNKRLLWQWFVVQCIPLIFYMPWLPTAYRQITTWPSLMKEATSFEIAWTIIRYLSFGVSSEVVHYGWVIFFVVLIILGLDLKGFKSISGLSKKGLIILWLFLPISITFILFRPAYLKFLLVASPAFCILMGLGLIRGRNFLVGEGIRVWRDKACFVIILIAIPSFQSLSATYFNPKFQRDNYRGISKFIGAIATHDDAIIIHAPGQQEVISYYYHGNTPIYPLPRTRPINPNETITELELITSKTNRIYGIYWATQEADPDGIIEGWLHQHAFKASDVWFGNVRLVSYAVSGEHNTLPPISVDVRFGKIISLINYTISPDELSIGNILQVGLTWQTDDNITENYTVFIQLLNNANQLIGQRDALPLTPTQQWQPHQLYPDRHGIYIEPGTPPGDYRLIMGLYSVATGNRLPVNTSLDYLELTTISIMHAESPFPIEAFEMQHTLYTPFLLGYDLYKLGYRSQPETAIHIGEAMHVNLYWQKPTNLPQNENIALRVVNRHGDIMATWSGLAAGIHYPMTDWADDEIVRGQYDLFLSGGNSGEYYLEVVFNNQTLAMTKKFTIYDSP